MSDSASSGFRPPTDDFEPTETRVSITRAAGGRLDPKITVGLHDTQEQIELMVDRALLGFTRLVKGLVDTGLETPKVG